jgi:hypothetical protein
MGSNIHMWVDNSHPADVLSKQYGFRVVYDAQSRLEAKLSTILINGDWCWCLARFDALVEIQSRLPEIKIGVCDKPIWSASRKGFYVISDTWDALIIRKTEVDWWQLVWFPYAILKHAFVLWLAMRDCFSANDRLSKCHKGDFYVFSAKVEWKVKIIVFFSVVSLPVSGRLEYFGAIFLLLLPLGRM